MTMTVVELLEATKLEVDRRWDSWVTLWDYSGDDKSCILGCLGYARWADFRERNKGLQDVAYAALSTDPVTGVAIELLAAHVEDDPDPIFQRGDISKVYTQNDKQFKTKADAKDFIDLALRGLAEGTT